MRRLILAGVVAAGLVAGGCDHAAPIPTGAATTAGAARPDAISFGRPPIVLLTRSGVMTTAVRTATALPATGLGLGATLDTTGADPDRGSELERIPGYRRCYANEAPVKAGLRLRPGRLVTVELRTEDRPVTRARVAVRSATRASTATRRLAAARVLGCARGPRERRCTGSVADNGLEIAVDRAFGGASCTTARAVLGQVATWVDQRCFQDLCVKHHRLNCGFRCTVAKVGEADWTITCRRGEQSVRGSTSE